MHGHINLAGLITSYDQILYEDMFTLEKKLAGVESNSLV